jgi:hypothetical protein
MKLSNAPRNMMSLLIREKTLMLRLGLQGDSTDEAADTGSIRDWVLKEMVSKRDEDQNVIAKILSTYKESARDLAALREDGKVTIQHVTDSAENQVLSYLLGAAYAKIAGLREDDGVATTELIEGLRLNDNTLGVSIKRLRDKGLIVRKQEAVYRVEYRKLEGIISRLTNQSIARKQREPRPGVRNVFKIYSESGINGLTNYLDSLGTKQLKSVVTENRLDPSGNSLKWKEKQRLVNFISKGIESRSRHGQVFMEQNATPTDDEKSTQPNR